MTHTGFGYAADPHLEFTMKKFVALALVAVISATVVGCSGTTATVTGPTVTTKK